MPRNPNWTKDELILALDLYFKADPVHTSEKNPHIIELSILLNELPIHQERPDKERFRNPSGVYMKLCNFLRLDEDYVGVGLDAGSKLDEEIWKEFAHDRKRLALTAAAIRDINVNKVIYNTLPDETEEFPEGQILYRAHRYRERNSSVVKMKKEQVLKSTGTLACEVCSFDFQKFYGDIGEGFIECHHILPLSQLAKITRTRLTDIVVVCSNCHRMLHRTRPWLTVSDLTVRMEKKYR